MTLVRPSIRESQSLVSRRGFSLVELLLSIFILAIGVIAISAIFPAGIIQQQQSTDDAIGPIVAQSALGVIRAKLDQEDFGTFEQFGIFLDDEVNFENFTVRNPSPGDWTWMRPSYVLRGGVAVSPQPPNLTPDPMHGAIDIFGVRHTRSLANFDDLPELDGEPNISPGSFGNPNGLFTTSDMANQNPGNWPLVDAFNGGIEIGNPDASDWDEDNDPSNDNWEDYEGPELLYGIPYNRNKHAILNPHFPGTSPTNYSGPYVANPARQGRNEPLVTILQSERVWPQGSAKPRYVWDCMFRRYQGRAQVAIFVYRVSTLSDEPRAYAASSGFDPQTTPSPQAFLESPLPARVILPDDQYWSPRGLERSDADRANKLDDLVVPGTESGNFGNFTPLETYGDGWQYPGQWLLDQNGNIHKVLAGREKVSDGPVRLVRPVPHVARHASNGNLLGPDGDPSTVDEAAEVKAVWFIPPETRDGMLLTPVFVTVRDL